MLSGSRHVAVGLAQTLLDKLAQSAIVGSNMVIRESLLKVVSQQPFSAVED